ncbi:alpha/beta fold hydrolase [Microbacterium sp. NIBRBAC000506063]|nr:alpha/beta fold hydrolase [Microbacterium sp. NIBRBAC000506063]
MTEQADTRTAHILRRGTGTPLLFVHGNAVDHRYLLGLDDLFDGWERIYPDLPGFGRTPALTDPGGLPEIAGWLDALVEEVLGATPFAIVGNSLGGLLARDLAARRPAQVLGFALLAPVVDSVRENRILPDPLVLVEDPVLLARLDPVDRAAYEEIAVVQSEANWAAFQEAVLPGLRAGDPDAAERLSARYALAELPDERLDGYDRPVLIVAGRQDAVVGFEDQRALAVRFPHATFAVLDHAGHNVHLDQPVVVRTLLAEWAARVAHSAQG